MERLIETVRKFPCLWNTDSEEYKLTDLKEAAWIEVVKECNLSSVSEARSFWKKLRDGHRQAISKKKTVSGQAATSMHKWKYEKQMEFLLSSMQNRRTFTNIPSSSNENSVQAEHNYTEESYDSEQDQSYGDLSRPKKKPTLISLMEKEQKMRAERSAQRCELRKEILLSCKDTSEPKRTTAMESFFTSMCMTTLALPETFQMKVQRQLFNIVMKAKEDHMEQSRNSSERSSSSAVHSFRGDSLFHLPMPIDSTSISQNSAMSNYSPTDTLHNTLQDATFLSNFE